MSDSKANLYPFARLAVFAAATAAATLLSGCALTSTASPGAPDPTVFTGRAIGGENPVLGATISFYETAATGVATNGVYVPGTPLTALGSTLTDANGNFGFATPLACTSSTDFVYVTAAGGNTGSGNNPNSLLLSAVGSCSNFGASTYVIINELSTVAAAYALQGFTSVSGAYTMGDAITSYSIAGNVATVNATNTLATGDSVTLSGFPTSTFFNGQTYTVLTANATSFTFTYNNPDVALTTEAGKATEMDPVSQYTIAGGVATIQAPNTLAAGQQVTLAGFASSTFLNGNYNVLTTGRSATQFQVAISHADVGATTEAGFANPLITATVPVVSVTASATNYVTASATGTVSAAGLAHAFLNAANLKSPSVITTNNTVPGNTGAVVPAVLINSLGDSLAACVNTTGGAATSASANDGTHCGMLFSYTTNPLTSVVPTNTVSAALNIARFPTRNVASICGLNPGTSSAFQPSLSCATGSPSDFSLAIAYSQFDGATNGNTTTSATNGLYYPYGVALDINDNVYIANTNASSQTQSNVIAFTSNGLPQWATAVDATTYKYPNYIATDALGNVFLVNNGTTAANELIGAYSASSGALQGSISLGVSAPNTLFVDASNNFWVGTNKSSQTQNIYKFNHGTGLTYTPVTFTGTPNAGYAYQLAPDASGNVFFANYNSTTATASAVLPYSATYNTAEVVATGSVTSKSIYGLVLDSSGNAWSDGTNFFAKLVPTPATGAVTGLAGTVPSNATYTATGGTASLRFMAIDGNNTLWAPDNNSTNSALASYNTTASSLAVIRLKPCITVSGTSCPSPAAGVQGLYGPRQPQVDSTGSVWVTSSSNGEVIQVIGAAAPAWPLLSLQKPGIMP